jgi:threonine dehydrogenase-like Zn-dependent dehydrogenase
VVQQPLEQCGGPVGLAGEGEVVDQPQAGVYPPQAQAFPIGQAKNKNLTVKMSNCNHRHYLPELVTMTRSGAVDPSKVLTQVDDVLDVIEAYEAFDRREPTWIKAALDPRA